MRSRHPRRRTGSSCRRGSVRKLLPEAAGRVQIPIGALPRRRAVRERSNCRGTGVLPARHRGQRHPAHHPQSGAGGRPRGRRGAQRTHGAPGSASRRERRRDGGIRGSRTAARPPTARPFNDETPLPAHACADGDGCHSPRRDGARPQRASRRPDDGRRLRRERNVTQRVLHPRIWQHDRDLPPTTPNGRGGNAARTRREGDGSSNVCGLRKPEQVRRCVQESLWGAAEGVEARQRDGASQRVTVSTLELITLLRPA